MIMYCNFSFKLQVADKLTPRRRAGKKRSQPDKPRDAQYATTSTLPNSVASLKNQILLASRVPLRGSLRRPFTLDTVLQNPRVRLDVVEGEAFGGIKHEQLTQRQLG